MRPRGLALAEHEQTAFRAVVAFLENRLEERATITWALRLKEEDIVRRYALLELIEGPRGQTLNEPWRTAWRLIEESWETPSEQGRFSNDAYYAQQRIHSGERSGSLISTIVELVMPRLKIESFPEYYLSNTRVPRNPKRIQDLFLSSLTSGELLDLTVVDLKNFAGEKNFLLSLAFSLDIAVLNGLDLARRIGWDGTEFWKIGRLNRVYYISGDASKNDDDPDIYSEGIAPSVKFLFQVVATLVEIDKQYGIDFASRWKNISSPVHLRLWVALLRDPQIATGQEVGSFLLSLNKKYLWDIHSFPEIAELRAKRFAELTPEVQKRITARICKLPPRNQWPKESEEDRVERARQYWAIRELRRIEIAGGILPQKAKVWLDSTLPQFPELVEMTRYDEGFPDTTRVRRISSEPEDHYDLLKGQERLRALESALASGQVWNDNPAGRASSWIQKHQNTIKVLQDFESVAEGGTSFPKVWELFGWAHSPPTNEANSENINIADEFQRVLLLIPMLSDNTIRLAIRGISYWLSSWEKHVATSSEALTVWLKLWPIAVDATNLQELPEEEEISESQKSRDLDTLNSPAGKLVGVFLASCLTVHPGDELFREGTPLRIMRDGINAAMGVSGSIVKSRLIEQMPYFMAADTQWTIQTLVRPLLTENLETPILWKSVARQRLSFEVMEILGNAMADRAIDPRFDRKTRQSLVFRIVVDCLHAYKDARKPSVTHHNIEQMLRSLDDEVRAHGAEAVQRFVRDLSKRNPEGVSELSSEMLFRTAAKPFIENVWPKEYSLVTPGVSRAFADIPAVAGEAFAEAVSSIAPFLIPFKCWSMTAYGLYGAKDDELKLKKINTYEKAAAFLNLLDKTIGDTERAVVPHELAEALEQIRTVAPALAEDRAFRRLAAAARR